MSSLSVPPAPPSAAFNGALRRLPAHELGKIAIKAALERAGVEPGRRVSEVIAGQILTAGQGQNPARQASIVAGIPVESPAWGVNQLCGIRPARGRARLPSADERRFRTIVVAGGQESMSMKWPHCAYLRNGVKMGNFDMVDTMIKDGLWDAFNGYHMGNTAENIAKQWQITRQQQDEFAGGVAEQGRRRPEGRAASRTVDRSRSPSRPARATWWWMPTKYPRHGTTIDSDGRADARPSTRKAPSRPAMPPASTTAPPPWC